MAAVVQFPKPEPASGDAALSLIRAIASETAKIGWSDHARFQMRERGISISQALTVMRKGKITSGPCKDEYGDWRYKLVAPAAGRRVQVVLAIDCSGKAMTVVTVM
jgi:hypothetical protein